MTKHINTIKLTLFVNEISNSVQLYDAKCLVNKIVLNLTPGHIRPVLGVLAKMGVYVRLTVTFPSI